MQYGVLHLFCGSGGGALGFARAAASWGGHAARFRTLGGVDVDPLCVQDFTRLVGVPATEMDLFSADDYAAFHGHEPPEGWREATPEDLRAASGNVRPDVVFASPPCKGVSGLLPSKAAKSPKYQALNHLTVRGIALALAAWPDDPPGLIVLENVPRLETRGAALLDEIEAILGAAGYRVDRHPHDLGELGGLAQHRRRLLLVARRTDRVPAILARVPLRPVRPIGSVLERLPMPDDPEGGPMHRLPRLQWLTWLRLALIPAGGDWRDLQGVDPGSFAIIPGDGYYHHSYGVTRWDAPAGTVTTAHSPSCGTVSVADPRLGHAPRKGVFHVARWDLPASTVVASARPTGSNGVAAVADPRLTCNPRSGMMGVIGWEEPSSTVTAAGDVHAQGAAAVADPRIPEAGESGVWVIVAEDGTWHRPLTTYELAMLQGLPERMPDGSRLVLAGSSHGSWRERIGNMVPPPAAEAVAVTMLETLLVSDVARDTVTVMFGAAIWVAWRRIVHRLATGRGLRA